MKKLILILVFFLFTIFSLPRINDTKMVMSDINSKSNNYVLIFDKDILTFRNFKLKLGLFTSYEYKITKVYIKYPENIKEYFKNKEYFSFDNSNFNNGIQKMKEEYNLVLKENYLFDELDKDINDVVIEMVELFCEEDALDKFKEKYPDVIINRISS